MSATTNIITNQSGQIALTEEQLRAVLAGRPEDQIETLNRFRNHCVLRRFSYEKAGSLIRKKNGKPYSRDTIYFSLNGHTQAEVRLDSICEAVERYLSVAESPAPVGGFIRTRMAREIGTYLEQVREERMIGVVVGQNACGKTTALEQTERENDWLSVIRVPEGGHMTSLLQAMACRQGLGERRERQANFANLMMEFFGPEDLIAFDEYDEVFRARSIELGNKTQSYIRRIYDKRGCGIVIVVDPSGYRRLQTVGADSPLRKVASRLLWPLILPPYYPEDLRLYATANGLEPAPDREIDVQVGNARVKLNPHAIEGEICGSHIYGLRVWLGFLRRGAKKAKAAGREIGWADVMREYALARFMEDQAKQLAITVMTGGKSK
ncbi:hypothetical protein CfE428DRAFT_5828 [Chthoniobacter flavus Ellin428]|uniref:AAA+ ATPase domain-containing protein n=1 Tax=Chthoniobacter flavus Ellin428 TaxID=497964 RepID=B4DA88_9BACT|nr:hypothetical protein [Chthoniobacter flavus]EDY16715.1 hypothetical protein CfE428DRAFT_5828 [Chthoniobacter flavus Ellin428]TCO87281.1 hypothetical protein EV701_123118 [Chthoniobacter flavus]